MPLDTQAKTYAALEERNFERIGSDQPIELKCRIIASTSKNLTELIMENRFRKDLYFILSSYIISQPPLRERAEDIELFAKAFLKDTEDTIGKKNLKLSDEFIEQLCTYHFPGNVPELRNIIKQSALNYSGQYHKN